MAEMQFHEELESTDFSFGRNQLDAANLTNPAVALFFEEFLDVARKEWADDVWRWFDANQEKKIITVKKWFLSFTFRVKHCGILVKVIAGPRPEGV